ncbi:MAG: DUF2905 domain-containing protein [Chloroflexi bacterium]|nr:DUF2905 domain-containing protein [Chloroflexota bacterium]
MESFGKSLVILGVFLLLMGGAIWFGGRLNLPGGWGLGRLPGDIFIQRDKVTFYFPLVSCLLASIVLTLLVNAILWLLRR